MYFRSTLLVMKPVSTRPSGVQVPRPVFLLMCLLCGFGVATVIHIILHLTDLS